MRSGAWNAMSLYRADFRETEWGGRDCIHLAEDRDLWCGLVNMVTNIPVP
jgi:hypothetical protein